MRSNIEFRVDLSIADDGGSCFSQIGLRNRQPLEEAATVRKVPRLPPRRDLSDPIHARIFHLRLWIEAACDGAVDDARLEPLVRRELLLQYRHPRINRHRLLV